MSIGMGGLVSLKIKSGGAMIPGLSAAGVSSLAQLTGVVDCVMPVGSTKMLMVESSGLPTSGLKNVIIAGGLVTGQRH